MVDDLFELIKSMTILELRDLNKKIEEEFGIIPFAFVPGTVPSQESAANNQPETEQTEFTVILKSFGENKIEVIKTVRQVISLGLAESKKLVESAPVAVKENVSRVEADTVAVKLLEAGAEVEII